MWLDYDKLKLIPIRAVLSRYGIDMKGKQIPCPLPQHTSKKTETSFSVRDNYWQCFSPSCQNNRGGKRGGDVIHFLQWKENITREEAGKRLAEWFGITSTKPLTIPEKPKDERPKPAEEMSSNSLTNQPLKFALKDINPVHDMIQSRGITVETAVKFNVGFFPGKGSMSGRIVFPIYEAGHLVAYAGRTTLEITEDNPKWLLGKGFIKSTLYGLDRCDPEKPLVVCESCWAVLFLYQKNIQAAALLGSDMTDLQMEALAAFRTITVALDNDVAGNGKAAPIVERLRAAGHKVMRARLLE